jgi:thioredoxin-like negative regulator of GroEL
VSTTYLRFRSAENLFEQRDYRGAATVLEEILASAAGEADHHGLGDARTLLARAYYHSAQLRKAESTTRGLLADDPTDAYAALLLARTLQRANRPEEAAGFHALAAALGAPGTAASGH